MTTTTVDVGTIPYAENLPQHMNVGDQIAMLLRDAAEQIAPLADGVNGHVEAGEALGLTGQVLGGWVDVADMIREIVKQIQSAADQAEAAAKYEREAVTPLVEAAADASNSVTNVPTVGHLREG